MKEPDEKDLLAAIHTAAKAYGDVMLKIFSDDTDTDRNAKRTFWDVLELAIATASKAGIQQIEIDNAAVQGISKSQRDNISPHATWAAFYASQRKKFGYPELPANDNTPSLTQGR